jgi:hypothetical protein
MIASEPIQNPAPWSAAWLASRTEDGRTQVFGAGVDSVLDATVSYLVINTGQYYYTQSIAPVSTVSGMAFSMTLNPDASWSGSYSGSESGQISAHRVGMLQSGAYNGTLSGSGWAYTIDAQLTVGSAMSDTGDWHDGEIATSLSGSAGGAHQPISLSGTTCGNLLDLTGNLGDQPTATYYMLSSTNSLLVLDSAGNVLGTLTRQ